MLDMKRRDFIALGGSAPLLLAAKVSVPARGQQPAMPVVGFLRSGTLTGEAHRVTAFRQGLKGQASSRARTSRSSTARRIKLNRLPLLVADLLRRQVALIVGNTPAALAAKAAATTVPIVFVAGVYRSGLEFVPWQPQPARWQRHRYQLHLGGVLVQRLAGELLPGAAPIAVLVAPHPKIPSQNALSRVAGRGFGRWAATHRPRCQQRPRDRDRLYYARPT